MGDRLLDELAGAVLDGTPIDWSAAEDEAGATDRAVLDQLRVLATLADVHRGPPHQEATAAPRSTTDRDAQIERWGHLRLLERVGTGSFGEVYRAWDTQLDREVALKLLPVKRSGSGGSEPAVIEEGRMLARVRHPGVVTIYGAAEIDGRLGLWMEFLRGRTLKQIIDDGRVFTAAEASEIGLALCGAVGAVHAAGLLHRDIKAQNVMLTDDGRIVLMDFGTGRELANPPASDLAGTPLYLAPEVLGGRPATTRSDVYSLGVLLFLLVTGSYPVDVRAVHGREPEPDQEGPGGPLATRSVAAIGPKLTRILARAADPRPEQRYESVEALAADLGTLVPRSRVVPLRHVVVASAVLLAGSVLGWEFIGGYAGSAFTPTALLADATGVSRVDAPAASRPAAPTLAVLPFENLSVDKAQRRHEINVEAYDLYLKGRALLDRGGVPNCEKAADLFEEVLTIEPAFAPAYAGLASAYAWMSMPTSGSIAYDTGQAIIRPAALRAHALDPLLAEAHVALGWMFSRERDWANAENAFQRAMKLDPLFTQAYTSYSLSTLVPLGKLDEARRILQAALEKDTLSLHVQWHIGIVQFSAGRYDEAISTLRRVASIDPGFPYVNGFLARALTFAGKPSEAIAVMERTDGARHLGRLKGLLQSPFQLAQPYVLTGNRAGAETLVRQQQDSPANLAIVYAALGDKDGAFAALERVAVVQPHKVAWMLGFPEFAPLRGDDRFSALRERFGLPPE